MKLSHYPKFISFFIFALSANSYANIAIICSSPLAAHRSFQIAQAHADQLLKGESELGELGEGQRVLGGYKASGNSVYLSISSEGAQNPARFTHIQLRLIK